MQGLTVAEPKFPGDDGAADPAVRAALAAYAAGQGSEHAALTALARSRLLVPVVAVLGEADEDGSEKSTEMAQHTRWALESFDTARLAGPARLPETRRSLNSASV